MSNKLKVVMTGGRTLVVELAPGVELFSLGSALGDSEQIRSVFLINGETATDGDITHLKSLLGSRAVSVRVDGQPGDVTAIPAGAQNLIISKEAKGALAL